MLKMYDFWNTLRLIKRMRKKEVREAKREVMRFSLATALVATAMLPSAAWANDFYGNKMLEDDSLLSGVTVTLSTDRTKAEVTGKVTKTVTVTDTPNWEKVCGVYQNSGSGEIKGNSVSMSAGNVKYLSSGYADKSATSDVKDNTATITGGTVTSNFFGGYSDGTGAVTGNTATVKGGEMAQVYGGYNASSGAATSNTVTVEGGEVKTIVYGGYSHSGAATGNIATITGGTIGTSEKAAYVYGGYSSSGEVKGNTVKIEDGTVNGAVYGGYSSNGTATGNTVAIVATSEAQLNLTNANIYGSNKDVTGENANKLDLSGVTTALTVKSISNFDAITMGTGVVTVTAASDLTNTTIDATAITSLTEDEKTNGRTLLEASGDGVKFTTNESTTVTVSDALKEYIVDTTDGVTGGVVTRGYKGDITATKISIVKGDVGTNVAGLYIDSAGKGRAVKDGAVVEATSGTLTISTDVKATGKIYCGAYAEGSSEAKGGTLEVTTGGEVNNEVYGGFSQKGAATSNTVNITGGTVSGKVYGGRSSGSGEVTSNTATITDGTVNGTVYGGYNVSDAAVTSNTVTVKGGTVSTIYGGYNMLGEVTSNIVNITGGKVSTVYGGRSTSGAATSNTVNITGGTVSGKVYGGIRVSGAATSNTVNITGGTLGSSENESTVYGGFSTSGVATSNTVNITGGTLGSSEKESTVYGGYSSSSSGTATGNTVKIVATNDKKPNLTNANLYGSNKAATGAKGDAANKLDLSGVAVALTAKSINNFDAITMGTGKVTVTETSNLTNTAIDGTVLTVDMVKANGYTFIDGGTGLLTISNTTTTLTLSDAVEAILNKDYYQADTSDGGTGGVSTYIYTKAVDSKKVGVTRTDGTNEAGIYIDSNGKKYDKEHLEAGTGGATSGTLTISKDVTATGKTYYGAYAEGEQTATGGTLVVAEGGKVSTVYGGYSYSGAVTDNTVTVEGGEVDKTVYGGYSDSGAANSNKVTISGGSIGTNDSSASVYGGYSETGTANSNEVTISGGTVGTDSKNASASVQGGHSGENVAESNKVTIEGSSTKVIGDVYGGKSNNGAAKSNEVTIKGGTVGTESNNASVQGGMSTTKVAESNKVTIEGSSTKVIGSVFGGMSASGAVNSNEVTIKGGTVGTDSGYGYVQGGNSDTGVVESNTVTIEGSSTKVIANVYGGKSNKGAVKSNKVTIKGGTLGTSDVAADVYGGYSESNTATATGNTVKIVATSEAQPDLTNANLYGSNKAATGATGENANKLDLSEMAVDLTIKSISQFDAIKMGTGKVTVTATSNLTNTAIDGTVLTVDMVKAAGYTFIDGGTGLLTISNTTLTLSDAVEAILDKYYYQADTSDGGTGGVSNYIYSKTVDSKKVGVTRTDGTKEAGIYIDKNGVKYDKDHLEAGTGGAETGTLTISKDVTATGKTYYGAYAEEKQTATGGTLEVKTGGKVNGSVYGGYSKSGTAESNKVTVEGSGTQVSGDVYGGYAEGNANSNEVAIASGASVSSDVYGGYSNEGAAESNKVKVEGTNTIVTGSIMGAFAYSDAKINSNEVAIASGASVGGDVYGVYNFGNGTVTGNSVNITGGTVGSSEKASTVYGGYNASSGAAESNKVTVEGSSTQVSGEVYGGYSEASTANSNEVTIASGASVGSNVYGGYSYSGTAESNKVTVEGSSTQVSGDVFGGYGKTGATGNSVNIKGGIVGKDRNVVYGGYSTSGTATDNIVDIVGGTIDCNVYAGYGAGDVTGNIVTINGVTVVSHNNDGYIYGGYSKAGSAESNEVIIGGVGSSVPVRVRGGYSDSIGSARYNKVKITAGVTIGETVCGGSSYEGAAIENSVIVEGTGTKVKGICGGEAYGESDAKDASKNEVTLSSGATAKGTVTGGYSYDGSANGNIVTITGEGTEVTGTVRGGESCGVDSTADSNEVKLANGAKVSLSISGGCSNSGSASGNIVTITGEKTTAASDVYGGYSASGAATSNTATVTGGTVSAHVYGGYSEEGAAELNKVTVEGSSTQVSSEVYGGYAQGNANSNEVAIASGANVGSTVYGGYSDSGSANKNVVTIKDSTLSSGISGGESYGDVTTAAANANTVTLTNSSIAGEVEGGYSTTCSTNENIVTVDGGSIADYVCGGDADGGIDAISEKNAVTIKGGATIGDGTGDENGVWGGYSKAGSANENTVIITGAGTKVTGEVYGGEAEGTAATANENAVTIDQDGEIVGNVYGGYSKSGAANDNIVDVKFGNITGDIYGSYSESAAATGTVNVSGTTTKITGNVYGSKDANATAGTVNWDGGTITGDIVADTVNITGNNSAERTKTQKITATTINIAKEASLSYEGSLDLTNTTKLTAAGTLVVGGDITYNKASGSIVADGGNVTAASTSFVDSNITALSAATNAFATDKDTTLNVVFDAASNTTYSTAQLTALKEAYYSTLGSEAVKDAKLNLINATLKVDDDKEQIVVKREDDSTGTELTIKTAPQVVDKNNNKKETAVAVVPQSYVAVAQKAEGKSPELQTVEKVTIESDFASKGLQVASETGKVEMKIAGSVVMTGGSDESSGIVVDENGKGLTTDIEVGESGYFAVGVEANTADQKGKLGNVTVSGAHALVGNDATKTDYTYEKLTVGAETATIAITKAALTVNTLSAGDGSIYVDPAYLAINELANNTLGVNLYVGEGSVTNIAGDATELRKAVEAAGLTTTDASTGFTVASDETVLGIDGNISVTSGKKLIVDSAVDNSGADVNNTTGAQVYFGNNSLLVVNAEKAESKPVITLDKQTVKVESTAKLYLRNALSNKNYTILSGASTDENGITVAGWGKTDEVKKTGETTLYANRLLKYTAKVDSGSYIITTLPDLDPSVFQGSFVYPALKEIADNNLLDADSSYGGIKFLSRATDATYIGDAQMTPVMEEMAAIAATSGVQHTALRASDLVVDTIGEHLTAAKAEKGANLWATPLRTSLTTTSRTESTANISGIMVGYDNGNEKGRFGVAIQGGWGTSHSEGTVSYYQNKNKFAGVSLYGSQKIGKFDLKASLGYTKFGNDVRTYLASGLNMGIVNTDIDAKAFTADVRVERTYETKSGLGITPHVGLRYTRLATDSYDNYIISGDSEKQNIWQLPIGVTFAQTLSKKEGWTLRPYLDLSFVPAFGGKETDSRVRFTGLSSVVSSATRIIDSTSFLGSLGFTAERGKFGMGLSYYLQKGSSEMNSTLALNLNWKF